MEELKATMVSVRYRNPEKTWLVATMQLDGKKETFLATGDIPYSETEEPVQLYGEWVQDKKYGKQFKVSTSFRILPSDTAGVSNYLAASEDIKGIGPVRARKLSDFFGASLIHILDSKPERLSECPGVSDELAGRIAAGWKRDSAIRQLSIFLAKHGISPRWAGKILKQWDPGVAVLRIQQNPYRLTEIEGIGFNTADEMAISMGGKKDCQERIEAACIYLVSAAVQDGNVFLHEHQLIDQIVKLVSPRGKNTDKVREQATIAVNKAIEDKSLMVEEVSDGFSHLRLLYLPHLYRAEKGLAERISELQELSLPYHHQLEGILTDVQEQEHVNYSTKQVEAIRGAFSNNTLVITGGPGTGKTTCVRAVCQVADRLHLRITLCAPTGRAAKRLAEVTGRDATTIHRLLQWRSDGPTRGRGNPIETDVLIVDESSMLDLDLADKLFEAVSCGTTVVFVGDVDQLPAVGAGTTLRDIINSRTVHVVTLDTIFRQAEQSLIVRNAHFIRRGEMPRFPEQKGVKENSYVMWIPPAPKGSDGGRDDAEWLKEKLARLVSKNIPEKFSNGFKPIDPIRDIQVLVPMKKHTLGSHELNKVLQNALNPKGEEFALGGKCFRVGDRVMQTKNNYEPGMDVYNGDIGFITSYSGEDKQLAVDFYGRTVRFDADSITDLHLAYAQTVHKSQGSEYPIVVVVMAYQHWPMLERNLIYTANTRAKDLCLFMASKGAIERAVKNNPVHDRNTFLAQRLKALLSKEAANA